VTDIDDLVARLRGLAAAIELGRGQCLEDECRVPLQAAADALSASQAELRDCERRCDEWREQSCRDSALAVCNETLRAEIRRLREALESLTAACEAEFECEAEDDEFVAHPNCNITFGHIRRARAALAGTEDRKP
jgi:hypothetical protein